MKVNQLYQQIADLNSSHVEKMALSQTQFEEASSTILAQAKKIDERSREISTLKEAAQHMEFTAMGSLRKEM